MTIYKDVILGAYVYYMLNDFKTSIYIHHPLEIWLQNQSISEYLKHPIGQKSYGSKVCSLGNIVGKLLAIFFVARINLNDKLKNRINNIIWTLILLGSLILNLNVFFYLLPAYFFDKFIIF